MGITDLDPDKQKKYDELKKRYQNKSTPIIAKNTSKSESFSGIINSLENQIGKKQATLKEIQSQNIFTDLKEKKQQLDETAISKKQHIQELKSNLQSIQKEIIHTVQEIRAETELKTNELSATTEQLSKLSNEEKNLLEKIQHEQKLRAAQENELEELRLERLNIVNKNKDTQKIQEEILQYRNRLDQIISDRSMLELEIKSQMNLLEEERQKELDIISKIIKQHKN